MIDNDESKTKRFKLALALLMTYVHCTRLYVDFERPRDHASSRAVGIGIRYYHKRDAVNNVVI